jgi:putative ABC transport system permease protein
LKLSFYLLLAVIIALVVFWVIALLMLKLIRKLGERWRLPKANRRMALMVVVFGVGLFSLLLLTTLRGDLINRWQASLPADAPNHFLINIQPDEVKPLRALLAEESVKTPVYPMILGRLVEVNGNPISPDDKQYQENQRAQRLLIREFNLSASVTMPEGNIISAGKWFAKDEQKGFSVEEGIANTLGLKMGDKVSFDIAGQRLTETITSLRTVQWDSMKPNFFVMAASKAFKDYPKTYITSIHLGENKAQVLPTLVKRFPSVTDIDISAILIQVRELINKAAFAVQAIFLFTLVAGVVVLFAALQSQKALRRKEIAILKSLGANRAYLRRNLLLEFAMIGALAGFLAGVLALIAGNVAAYALFELTPEINLKLIILGTFVGALLVSVAGYLNVRGLLAVLPVSLFR